MADHILKAWGDMSRMFFEDVLPLVDIVQDGTNLILYADVPGVDVSDVTLTYNPNDNELHIRAIRKSRVAEGPEILYRERPRVFERTVKLPFKISIEDAKKAGQRKVVDGVFEITIPITAADKGLHLTGLPIVERESEDRPKTR